MSQGGGGFGFLTMSAMVIQYQKDKSSELELVKQDRFTASKDDDLIDWFDGMEHRKKARRVKTALRQVSMTVAQNDEFDEEFISDDLLDELLGAL